MNVSKSHLFFPICLMYLITETFRSKLKRHSVSQNFWDHSNNLLEQLKVNTICFFNLFLEVSQQKLEKIKTLIFFHFSFENYFGKKFSNFFEKKNKRKKTLFFTFPFLGCKLKCWRIKHSWIKKICWLWKVKLPLLPDQDLTNSFGPIGKVIWLNQAR